MYQQGVGAQQRFLTRRIVWGALAAALLAMGLANPAAAQEPEDDETLLLTEEGAEVYEAPGDGDKSSEDKGANQDPSTEQRAPKQEKAPKARSATSDKAAQDSGADAWLDTLSIVSAPVDVSRVGGSAHRVDEKELDAQEPVDPHRVLLQVPGVYLREEDGFGLRPNIGLRGVSSNRSQKVTLMEDGILFGPAPYSAPPAYYFPMTLRMTGIEVFKGPAAIRFGPNTIGGAINYRTREIPNGHAGEIDVAGGMYRSGKVHGFWGMSGERWGVLLEGARLQTKGFKNLDNAENLQTGNTGFDKNEFMLKARYNTKPGRAVFHSLELKLGYSDETSFETYLGLSEEDFRATPNRRYAASQLDRFDFWRTQVQLQHRVIVGSNFELESTVYRHDQSLAYDIVNGFESDEGNLNEILRNPSGGNAQAFYQVLTGERDSELPGEELHLATNDRTFVSQGINIEGALRMQHAWFGQEFRFGGRLHYDTITRDHTEQPHVMRNGVMVATEDPEQQTTANTGTTYAGALYLKDEMSFGEDLVLVPGIRLELIHMAFQNRIADTDQSRFDAVVIPGVGSVYRPLEWLSLVAGAHRGFSPVTPQSDESEDPETSVNYEFGTRFHPAPFFDNELRGEIIGFINDYRNITAVCTFSQGCTDEQIGDLAAGGKALVGGFETLVDYDRPVWQKLRLGAQASYTFTHSRLGTSFVSDNPFFGNVSEGDELAYLPKHQGAVTLKADHPRGYARIVLTTVGQMRDTAGSGPIPQNEVIDRYAVVDVNGGYRPTDRDTVYLQVNNLFNSAYLVSRRPFGARPGLPFRLMVGYKHQFGTL